MHGHHQIQNFNKQCVFFVVPGNGQALLRMTDTAALNIINLNIDSIQKEIRNYKANRGQEMHTVTDDCKTRMYRRQSNKMTMAYNTIAKQTN